LRVGVGCLSVGVLLLRGLEDVLTLTLFFVVVDASGCDIGDSVMVKAPEVAWSEMKIRVARRRWSYDRNGETYSLEAPVRGAVPIDGLLRSYRILSALRKVAQNKTTVRDQECPMF